MYVSICSLYNKGLILVLFTVSDSLNGTPETQNGWAMSPHAE